MTDERRGLGLARDYWRGVVAPILPAGLPHAAARIGTGSDVLGLDDVMSRDHDWGLRLQVLVAPGDVERVRALLERELPPSYAGLPTRIVCSGNDTPVLGIDVTSVEALVRDHLGFDPRSGATARDWLSLTGQSALEVTAGEVFADTTGELTALRQALACYPDDVRRYVIACGWQRLDQELPLMSRAADRGDDLGSRVIAARLVDIAMHLGFVICREWAPYPKWRGTLFARLPLPPAVGTHLLDTLRAVDRGERQQHLAAALDDLAGSGGVEGLPGPVCVPFWDRPYLHLDPRLVPVLLDGIGDPQVRALPPGIGSIEQWCDNVDVLTHPARRRAAISLRL